MLRRRGAARRRASLTARGIVTDLRPSADIQLALTPEVVDLAWGQPDPALLPSALVAEAAARVLGADGELALGVVAQAGRKNIWSS